MNPTYNPGDWIISPGKQFAYKVVGAVCRLYDREDLPYPSCSLQWRGKQPSWNRNGKQHIPDISYKNRESYYVELYERVDHRRYDHTRDGSPWYNEQSPTISININKMIANDLSDDIILERSKTLIGEPANKVLSLYSPMSDDLKQWWYTKAPQKTLERLAA